MEGKRWAEHEARGWQREKELEPNTEELAFCYSLWKRRTPVSDGWQNPLSLEHKEGAGESEERMRSPDTLSSKHKNEAQKLNFVPSSEQNKTPSRKKKYHSYFSPCRRLYPTNTNSKLAVTASNATSGEQKIFFSPSWLCLTISTQALPADPCTIPHRPTSKDKSNSRSLI